MNNKKSRSSLKKVSSQADDEPDPARILKRRISFSGKKFIREFDTTEKPRDYDNSYEISDHTNGDDSSGQSHGTGAASVLQSTAHISMVNDMEKENVPLASVVVASALLYDQHSRLSDSTLKLQTSINVTLLPDELVKGRRHIASPAPSEVTTSDSLSLYDVERVKLRENSLYRMPVFEKTMDLVPQQMALAGLEQTHHDKENIQQTIGVPTDISCVAQNERDIKQKTVFFGNSDISCDFSQIEPPEISGTMCPAAKQTQEQNSFDTAERDYMNYLPDDSTLSSPLIPLDVISENGISKKLNFRQLNDALNSGRIQLFPHGPRTPTTDRKAKQRFWHGLEQQPVEQDVSPREVIKPRGTLNFNESMVMSPAPQGPEPKLKATADQSNQPVKAKSSQDTRRNYRFSQADELMLDNTNFLVHAKMGDETQSRNNSKCSSRRETTYDNTAMELDDLEQHEAAVTAVLETAKLKQSMNQAGATDENDFVSHNMNPIQNLSTAAVMGRSNQKHSRTIALNELIDETHFNANEPVPAQLRSKQRQTLHMSESMEEASFRSHNEVQSASIAASTESQRNVNRQTLCVAEPIVEDIVMPQEETAAPSIQQPNKVRRDTLYLVEAMEEDFVISRQEFQTNTLAPATNEQISTRRQTLHMADPMEEESFCSNKKIISVPTADYIQSHQNNRRETLLLAEPIKVDEEVSQKESKPQRTTCAVVQPCNNRRQTLHMADPIEEDSFSEKKVPTATSKELQHKRNRQTLNLAEPIEEEIVKTQQDLQKANPGTVKQCTSRKRQTLNLSESIEEDIVKPQQEQAATAMDQQRRRQTLHLADAIEEDSLSTATKKSKGVSQCNETIAKNTVKPHKELKSQPSVSAQEQQGTSRRQTLLMAEPINEDSFCSRKDLMSITNAVNPSRPKLQKEEAIVKDISILQLDLKQKSVSSTVELQSNSRRQTLHMADPIEEDSFCSMPIASNKSKNSMQTNKVTEDVCKEVNNSRGQTLDLTDPFEEDSFCSRKDFMPINTAANKSKSILQMDKANVDISRQQRPVEQKSNSNRQTLHLADPIEDDSLCSKSTAAPIEANFKQYRKTMLLTEPIDVDEAISQTHLQSKITPAIVNKPRQTLLISEPIQEDIIIAHKDHSSKSMHKQVEVNWRADKVLINQNNKKANQTYNMEEAIEIDNSYIQSVPTSSLKQQQERKPRYTVHTEEPIDEEMPKMPSNAQHSSKSRFELMLTESMEMELLSQSLSEKAGDDCHTNSSEWLAQMRAKARQSTLKSMATKMSFSSPGLTADKTITRTSLDTPKMNKRQQSLHQNFFPITPGRSMIEYEDLEEECMVESPAAPSAAAHSIYHAANIDLDMDTSNYGTPKQISSFNIKRLPIHLTPNLPQPKKRNTQQPVKMEEDNAPQLDMEVSAQNVEQLTPVRNRSRIPVLSKSVNSPWREAEQLDATVQMVRAQMMRQARSHFETEITDQMKDNIKRNPSVYEDNPITISDVSSHFTAQRELAKLSLASENEQLAKMTSVESRSSNENSNKSYALAHKKFINLSGDTAIFAAAEIVDLDSDDNEIDKTRLSLVSTLLDEEDDLDINASSCSNNQVESDDEPEICLEQLNPPALAGAVDACKKCKHCRRSMEITIGRRSLADSFELPDWRELDVELERLERLRQRPRLEDVHKYWELKKLERYSNSADETTVNETHSNINHLNLAQMMDVFNKKYKECKQSCPKPMPVLTFVESLYDALRVQLPNWIFDYQLQFYRKYIFSHRKVTTFRIVVNYEPLDMLESKIRVRSIQMETTNLIPMALWNVYEHLMDFQLKLNLPLNLDHLLDGNDVEAFVKFLQHIDRVCLEIETMCNNMHIMLIKAQARLLREPNRTVVRKTVRCFVKKENEAYMRVEKTHFKIEIGNVQEISFKDILQPPLYRFDENIQFLPKGVGFLEAFLQNPEKYLKTNEEVII